jgi:YfiR/HmsC-like
MWFDRISPVCVCGNRARRNSTGWQKFPNQTHGQVLKVRMHFSGKDEPFSWRPQPRAALGQQRNVPEDQVKAAYLLNFAKLAEWPYALPEGPSPLVIGVSGGEEDFLSVLKAEVAGKVIGIHPVQVKSVSSEQEMRGRVFSAAGRHGQSGPGPWKRTV